jgi:hypothetical protein
MAYGANDAVASIATLLGAMDMIGRSQISELAKQPLFFFANADEWGYAGSRRFVKDIKSFTCEQAISAEDSVYGIPQCTSPVYPSTLFQYISTSSIHSISDIIAIDQVGSLDKSNNLYVHTLSSTPDTSSTVSTVLLANENLNDVTVSLASTLGIVPPSPLTSFINQYSDLKEYSLVISGYNEAFGDPNYHSRFDTGSNINLDDVVR